MCCKNRKHSAGCKAWFHDLARKEKKGGQYWFSTPTVAFIIRMAIRTMDSIEWIGMIRMSVRL
jgi:hypothetical protein